MQDLQFNNELVLLMIKSIKRRLVNTIQNLHVAYGFTQPLLDQVSPPILSPRSPLPTDKAQFGTIWINRVLNVAFVLTSIDNNQANWQQLAGAVNLPSLIVNPGPISLTGTTSINTTGAALTTIGNISSALVVDSPATFNDGVNFQDAVIISNDLTVSGNVSINTTTADNTLIAFGGTGAVAIGNITGEIALAGLVTVNDGMVVSDGLSVEDGFGAIGPVNINSGEADSTDIGTGGTGSVSIGNITGGTSFTGQVDISTGNLQFNTAATGIDLPGPVTIRSGAGAPAGGLAVNIGDVYINTTAATAATRIYVATAVGVWTNLTAAA